MEKMYSWSKNGMKMIIDSGFKEFDKQTNCLSRGNAIANTQYSNYIRPYYETKNPVGQEVEKGFLRDYDLKYFSLNKMTNSFRDWLDNITKNDKVMIYEYFIYRNKQKEVIGWLVQSENTKKIIGREYCRFSTVRVDNCLKVLNFCARFLMKEC